LNNSENPPHDTGPAGIIDKHSEYFKNLEDIPLEIAVYDLKGKIVFLNSHFYTGGLEHQMFIGKNDSFYFKKTGFKPESDTKRKEHFKNAVKSGRVVRFTEKLVSDDNKKILYYKRTVQLIYKGSDNEKYISFFGSNITAVILSQKELKYLAFHDKLTGLGNRDAFNSQLDQMLLEAHRLKKKPSSAIIFCDLDNFKLVNDSLGHDIGDLLLIECAQKMRSVLRRSDYLFRLGGDEFVIMLKNLKSDVLAGRVAEKIIQTLAEPFAIKNHDINYITASIGIALYPADGLEREALLNKADMAMYEAKKSSKNNFKFYSDEMTTKARKRLTIVKNLRELISQKDYDKQFHLVYQPIVERSGSGDFKIIASEALVRWNHPQMGDVSPGLFIPIAEESNLINHFGDWILNRSLEDFKNISSEFADQALYMSVNLSAKQLNSPDLIDLMQTAVRNTGIDPSNVQIEITETSIVDEHSAAYKNIHSLKDLGFRFAIDDFGVGFASLNYLQKIPAHVIKIDQSFVQKALASDKNGELVKAIIALGKNLNKEVIAEGVEEQIHLDFLNANECFKYQGYLFSKPLQLDDLKKMLSGQSHIHGQ